jgi:hypothetical protein
MTLRQFDDPTYAYSVIKRVGVGDKAYIECAEFMRLTEAFRDGEMSIEVVELRKL